ncbi:MAG: GNAT family N-acetyltransferase [Acidiferrobacteraceae bacterium]|jgi:GNAT superfamily N-acetyltransferase|nr:GNAT family N-acetyltransferase [Acidiferrobacteraceae bacterium]
MLRVRIRYLEMTHKPDCVTHIRPPRQFTIKAIHQPEPSFYRFLYHQIGEPWLWYERRLFSDDELISIIHRSDISVNVLYSHGSPVGFFELDSRFNNEIELAYFGLLESFIGQGLGTWLLDQALDLAWSKNPNRIWVHTCNLDHPNAIRVYERAGFVLYREKTIEIEDPRTQPFWQAPLI